MPLDLRRQRPKSRLVGPMTDRKQFPCLAFNIEYQGELSIYMSSQATPTIMQKFKNNYSLWTILALVLFVSAWFIPGLFTEGGNMVTLFHGTLVYHLYKEFVLSVLFLIVSAVVVSWALQALIVVWRQRRKKSDHDVA
jgi:hypothetical protein